MLLFVPYKFKRVTMKRADFLKTIGISGAALALPSLKSAQAGKLRTLGADCNLVPSETAGPFPLDLTDNTFFFRQDIREDRIGTPLNLRMRVIGAEDCAPMQNVRVNIWHCDNEGNYSGYGTQEGLTYLRGYQMTDANGEVNFITAFPGWYPGRVCHIHFQVYVNSNYAAISQFTFDHDTVNEVYANAPELYPDGADPQTPESDGVFNDGYELQLSSLAPSEVPELYEAFYECTVQGAGNVGVSYQDARTEGQLTLGQNAPNPFQTATRIPFELKHGGHVQMDLWHPNGERIRSLDLGNLAAGSHELPLNFSSLPVPAASYVYQITLTNAEGKFVTAKRMTVIQ